LKFEWDEAKNQANYEKHGIRFSAAALAFDDPDFVMLPDRDVDGEERWHTIGYAGAFLLLLVVHTLRDENDDEIVRIISARDVTSHERRRYEDGD